MELGITDSSKWPELPEQPICKILKDSCNCSIWFSCRLNTFWKPYGKPYSTAVSYFKYFLSVVLDAVTIALSIIVSNAILSYGIFDISGRGTGWTGSILYLLEMCFISALTVGSVKGAQQLTQKVLGLG